MVALAQLSVSRGQSGRPNVTVVSLALMAVSPQWIPVESSHELAVAERLVQERRAFMKPLRFDADQDVVFPDFILRDTNEERGTPMEVWGRSDAAYRARRQEKIDYYRRHFGADRWWHWNASAKDAMPLFPPRA